MQSAVSQSKCNFSFLFWELDLICHFVVIDCMFLFLQALLAVVSFLLGQLQILPIQGLVLCLRLLLNVVLINFCSRRALQWIPPVNFILQVTACTDHKSIFCCLAQSSPHTVQCTQKLEKKESPRLLQWSQNKFNCLTCNSSVIINWHVLISFLEIKLSPSIWQSHRGCLAMKSSSKLRCWWNKCLSGRKWGNLHQNFYYGYAATRTYQRLVSTIHNWLNDIWPQIRGYSSSC